MDYPAYKENEKKKTYLNSIKNNIIAILAANSEKHHKKDLLDICIWQITEIDGKYNTRYRSEGAMDHQNWKEVRHEHVYPRKHLIDRLFEGNDIDAVISEATACLVTKAEHEKLSHTFIGWERYKNANIRVYDLKIKEPLHL